jgi:GNAT superfamily N-acetyltransferase
MMSLILSKRFNIETLAVIGSGQIKELGAYIKKEYRGKGIGTRLLMEVVNYCQNSSIPYIHVNFETANPNASKFWPKYFKPAIRSVRRTINKDTNYILNK